MPEQDNRQSSRRHGNNAETRLDKSLEGAHPTLEASYLPNSNRESILEELNNSNSKKPNQVVPTESFQTRFARQNSEVREFIASWMNAVGVKNPHSIDPQSLSPHMRERALRMIDGNVVQSDNNPDTIVEGIKQLKQALIDPHTTALAIYRDLRALAKAEQKGVNGVSLTNTTRELNKRINEIPHSMHSEISSLIDTALERADSRGLDELGKSILLTMKSSLNLEPNLSLGA